MTSGDQDRFHRRGFFRSAAARAMDPLARYIERHLVTPLARTRLRPPGAIDEDSFLNTCKRCGACVEVCPAHAILPLASSAGAASGTPFIDPDVAACVVCDGLQCTHVCPSGALQPLQEAFQIRMGVAEVYESLCVRSRGESCTVCVERCPMGPVALMFVDQGPPRVLAEGCVGCGVCQFYCPTSPKAITVRPL